jgi:2-oxoglutarate dehydrogenase E1 component
VNGDDVEAIVYTIKPAMEFRQRYHIDVFVDILCYRKYGHNEGDEPRFTQPLLYKAIEQHKNPRDIYAEKLDAKGILSLAEARKLNTAFDHYLEGKYLESEKIEKVKIRRFLNSEYKNFENPIKSDLFEIINTSVSRIDDCHCRKKSTHFRQIKKFFKK